jgi:exosortase A-associated hydrolase 1/exosortase A-associated hydrolase 2
MSSSRPVHRQASFVDAAGGSRLRIVSQPEDGQWLGTVIWVHAFAEEMNKTRRISAQMAQRLASAGWRVVQRDLYGCGDSAGDFADASWNEWLDEIDTELRQADSARPIWLWCVRAGALLGAAALVGRPDVNLLLWQPVTSGARHVQQFLRLSTGARVLGSAKGASALTPIQSLRAGVAVEVGGYTIDPALALGLERASFDVPADYAGRIVWFEISADETPEISHSVGQTVERLRARGVAVELEALTGPAFWQTPEIEECAELLRRSSLALGCPPTSGGRAASVDRSTSDTSAPTPREQAISFRCGEATLQGILNRPSPGAHVESTAIVVVVGGPQYRVGSHRQFVHLARRLGEQGFASLRFDYRGMGDSEGDMRNFADVGPDLHAAIAALSGACPSVRRIVVWGLCDAASAAMIHAGSHADVAGIVAANPWARSEASLAATHVKHYYAARLLSREFWAKLIGGRLDVRNAIGTLVRNLNQAWGRPLSAQPPKSVDDSFQSRMARGVAGFHGRILLIIAGNDLTAKEFLHYAGAAPSWRGLLEGPRISRVDVAEADHTFSSRAWSTQVEDATIAWLRGLGT